MTRPRRVAELMTRDIVTLSEEDNLEGIADAMKRYSFRHVPVVDGDRLVGIVSDRDVLRLAMSPLLEPNAQLDTEHGLEEQTFVARIMTRDPITVGSDASLAEAAELMVVHKIDALPVVEGERLVGIVTSEDVLRAAKEYFGP